jgi:hypothetical protein
MNLSKQYRLALYWLATVFIAGFPFATDAQTPTLNTRWTSKVKLQSMPWSEYPRPQLVRKDWLCLNGWWDYRGGKTVEDATQPSEPISFSGKVEKIHIPFCPESSLSGIMRKQEINMWYRKSFTIPDSWKTRQLLLHFDAVDHEATIFINGHKAGSHAGGYEAFSINITPFIKKGVNELIVAAHDLNDGQTPSGKNGPRGDYTFTSGIWQTVWLEPVNKSYIHGLRLTPDLAKNQINIQVLADSGKTVQATVLNNGKAVATTTASSNQSFALTIPQPVLWSPDHPFLYQLKVKLKDRNGSNDEVLSYFGMRDIKLGKLKGVMRPLLNGKFVMQIGLLDQGYWPDGVFTPPSDEAMKSDMLITKQAGFNLIRKHMKVEPQRFYYWADKLGLLVWQDMPAIWFQDVDTAVNRPRYRKELKAMMDSHYNSPSIISWIPFNENWGAFDVKQITAWIKNYDPSRLVNGNSGFNNNPTYQTAYGDPGNGDFVDTHLYSQPYKPSMPDANRAASLGEYGGIGLFIHGHMWPVKNDSYAYTATTNTLTDQYILFLNQIDNWMKYNGLSTAVYTQTTDVEHEINGILTYDREILKIDLPRVRTVNRMVIEDSYQMNNHP